MKKLIPKNIVKSLLQGAVFTVIIVVAFVIYKNQMPSAKGQYFALDPVPTYIEEISASLANDVVLDKDFGTAYLVEYISNSKSAVLNGSEFAVKTFIDKTRKLDSCMLHSYVITTEVPFPVETYNAIKYCVYSGTGIDVISRYYMFEKDGGVGEVRAYRSMEALAGRTLEEQQEYDMAVLELIVDKLKLKDR